MRDHNKWPDPDPEMIITPQFESVWQCIKSWDINVPAAYSGYCGATGNHVRAIHDALANSDQKPSGSYAVPVAFLTGMLTGMFIMAVSILAGRG